MQTRRRGKRWSLRLVCCIIGAGWLILVPAPAEAHAILVSSNPTAGATLGATPGVVVLTFDEPLVARLSHATVVDPTGRRFEDSVSGGTMRVPLSTNAPGVYRVDWTTVSQVDGHTITGAFRFGVGVPAGSAATGGSPRPSRGDGLIAAARAIEYALLLLACGFVVLRRLGPGIPMRVPAVPVATAVLIAGATVVLAEAAVATSGFSITGLQDYLTIGVTGWARVARVGLELAILIVALVRGRLSPVLLTAVVGAVAVAGHAANVEPAWAGMAVNAAHLAAAGVWAGGIMALAFVRVTGGWPSAGRALLPRFSTVAPWAFGVSVGLGLVQAAQLLGGLGDVLGTAYGLTLVAKALAVAAMIPLSLLAWRRLRVMVRGEAAVALLVVAAAAALAAFPVVPREAGEAAEAREAAAGAAETSPFPRPGDYTIGGRAGDTMVGLTVHPGRPGRNQIFAYLAPAPRVPGDVRLSVAGNWLASAVCGPPCRTVTVELRGRERIQVQVPGDDGGIAAVSLPALPAKDGAGLAERAAAQMDRLRSYRVDEVLSGIRSTYVYARPHAMWLRTWFGDGPQDTLWLGPKVYVRDSPQAPWKLRSEGVLAPVPYFAWNPFKPFVAAHIVGNATIGGVPVTRVSFFGGHGDNPETVWFTLWIDRATGMVLRSQMWAPTHFMDDRYHAFDEPVDIPRPIVE